MTLFDGSPQPENTEGKKIVKTGPIFHFLSMLVAMFDIESRRKGNKFFEGSKSQQGFLRKKTEGILHTIQIIMPG